MRRGLFILSGLALLVGCAPQPAVLPTSTLPPLPTATAAPATPRPTLVPTAAPTAAPTPTAVGTQASALATAGQAVYATRCQVCHGDMGQGLLGPALIGPRANPAKYGPTAADLHAYIRQNMPQDNPGSLAPEEYLQVATYLLVANDLVQPSERISEAILSQVSTVR